MILGRFLAGMNCFGGVLRGALYPATDDGIQWLQLPYKSEGGMF